MDAYERWYQGEKEKRTSNISDPTLRDSIPDPTPEEFDMVLDPKGAEEQDFSADYQ